MKWQYPIAYFLTATTDSDIQVQIVTTSINFLTEHGFNCHALVFDGTSKNLATATKLGCKLFGNFDVPLTIHPEMVKRSMSF